MSLTAPASRSTPDSEYKNTLTLFAHEKSAALIDTFPRSGSTVILSNLALANLGLQTDYKSNNVNQMRAQLLPKKDLASYQSKVLLVRSPVTRLESFFLTKLVAGEPKSVVAIGSLLYKCLRQYPLPFFKQLKGFFSYKGAYDLNDFKLSKQFDLDTQQALIDTRNLVQNLSFTKMLDLFSIHGLPKDSHVYPQFHMKKFRLSEYSEMFNLNNFEAFVQWYNKTTGHIFSTKYNKTQPNNRLSMKKFDASPRLSVLDLQLYRSKNMTPISGSIIDDAANEFIKTFYSNDYDMHLVTSSKGP